MIRQLLGSLLNVVISAVFSGSAHLPSSPCRKSQEKSYSGVRFLVIMATLVFSTTADIITIIIVTISYSTPPLMKFSFTNRNILQIGMADRNDSR